MEHTPEVCAIRWLLLTIVTSLTTQRTPSLPGSSFYRLKQYIYNWLAKRAFGKAEHSIESGDKLIHGRSSSLEFTKKAVSFFIQDNAPHWCNGHDNPTKHSMHLKAL
jgi:hypothetical protein